MVTPRAPLQLPGSPGYHWYLVPRVGYPDPRDFDAARAALAELHDRLWEETGVGAGAHRPRRLLDGRGDELRDGARAPSGPPVAGVLAFSGFVPTVEGWEPRFDDRTDTRAFIAHGSRDPVIGVGFAAARPRAARRGRARRHLPRVGARPQIDPAPARRREWLAATLPAPLVSRRRRGALGRSC